MALFFGALAIVPTTTPARKHEEAGRDRVAGDRNPAAVIAPAKDEKRQPSQAEEDEVDRDHVAEDLLVRARQRDDDGHDPLQGDRHDRHPGSLADPGHGAKEEPVVGHRVVDARRREHALAEEAERRNRDAEGDERRAALSQGQPHHRGCRRRRGGEPAHA